MLTNERWSNFNVPFYLTVVTVGVFLGGLPFRQRVNPGGPFFAMLGHMLPMLFAVAVIAFCTVSYRGMTLTQRRWLLIFVLVTSVVIAMTIRSIIVLAPWPNARGAMIGV